MKIILKISDRNLMGANLPAWYGFAYREFDMAYTVLVIIPFNLIIRYAVKVYWLIYRFLKSAGWRDKLDEAYWRGFNDGNTMREHHYDRLARIIMGKEE